MVYVIVVHVVESVKELSNHFLREVNNFYWLGGWFFTAVTFYTPCGAVLPGGKISADLRIYIFLFTFGSPALCTSGWSSRSLSRLYMFERNCRRRERSRTKPEVYINTSVEWLLCSSVEGNRG